MKRNGIPALVFAVLVAGCASTPKPQPVLGTGVVPGPNSAATSSTRPLMATIEPVEVIQLAAESAPKGTLIRSGFVVKATGAEGDRIYLNSEPDYRDQRNLTVVIGPSAAEGLKQIHGADLRSKLSGRFITVTGVARRTKIWFTVDGKRTDKYYYQTHVLVSDARQLEVSGSEG